MKGILAISRRKNSRNILLLLPRQIMRLPHRRLRKRLSPIVNTQAGKKKKNTNHRLKETRAMNKVKIAAALIFLLSAASGTGLMCPAAKAEWFKKKPKNGQPVAGELNPQEQKLKEEQAGLLNENTNLLRENEALKNENKALREDRDNLINRAKNLLADVNRLKELEDAAGRAIQEKDALEKEKTKLGAASAALKEELSGLQEAQKKIIQERDYMKAAYEKAKKD